MLNQISTSDTAQIYVKLPQNDINKIQQTIELVKNIPSLTAKQLQSQLGALANGTGTCALFPALLDFISYSQIEGCCSVTYIDTVDCPTANKCTLEATTLTASKFKIAVNDENVFAANGFMTLGVGTNLEQQGAQSLIEGINNKFNTTYDYRTLRSETGQPVGGMTNDQISFLFLLTLAGTDTFTGKAQTLADQLGTTLANTPFPPYVLIALQSLAFQNANLINGTLLTTLDYYSKTSDFRPVLVQIVDCSNKLYEGTTPKPNVNGIEHRRLMEAGMFCAQPAKVQISYRKYVALKNSLEKQGKTVVPVNGDPSYGSPYGVDEQTYQGYSNTSALPGCKSDGTDVTKYGTSKDDTIYVGRGSVSYGGEGNDILRYTVSKEMTDDNDDEDDNAIYYAANEGLDHYEITAYEKSFVYDEDGGYLNIDNNQIQGVALQSGNNVYSLNANNHNYTLNYMDDLESSPSQNNQANSNGYLTINSANMLNPVTVANYRGGLFNIGLMQSQTQFLGLPVNVFLMAATALSSNNIALVIPHSLYPQPGGSLTTYIYTPTGQFVNQFDILPKLDMNEGFNGLVAASIGNDCFVAAWIKETNIDNDETSGEITQVQAAICSANAVLETFIIPIPVPGGNNACFDNDPYPYDCYISSLQGFSYADGTYKLFFEIAAITSGIYCFDSTSQQTILISSQTSLGQAVPLYNGYMLVLGDEFADDYSLKRYDIHNQLIETYKVVGSGAWPKVAGMTKGFFMSYLDAQTSSAMSKIFYDGIGWSEPLILGKVTYGHAFTLPCVLPNNNNLVLLYSAPSPYVWATAGVMVDSHNKPIGNSFNLPEGRYDFCLSLTNGDRLLIASVSQFIGPPSTVVFGRYFNIHALQPGLDMLTDINSVKNDAIEPSENNETKLDEVTSNAATVQPRWFTPLTLINTLKIFIKESWGNLVMQKPATNNVVGQATPIYSSSSENYQSSSVKLICQLTEEADTTIAKCEHSDFTVKVYPKFPEGTDVSTHFSENAEPFLKADEYPMPSSVTCKVIQHNGEDIAYIEGKKTTLAVSTHLLDRPLQNLDGTIALGFVAGNYLSKLFKPVEPIQYVDEKHYKKEMLRFMAKIIALRAEFPKISKNHFIFKNLEMDLMELKAAGKATQSELSAFRSNIKFARKNLRNGNIDLALQNSKLLPIYIARHSNFFSMQQPNSQIVVSRSVAETNSTSMAKALN